LFTSKLLLTAPKNVMDISSMSLALGFNCLLSGGNTVTLFNIATQLINCNKEDQRSMIWYFVVRGCENKWNFQKNDEFGHRKVLRKFGSIYRIAECWWRSAFWATIDCNVFEVTEQIDQFIGDSRKINPD